MNKFLYIFPHLPKCAGTTFINHIKKNLPEEEQLELQYNGLDLPETGVGQKEYLRAVEKFIDLIPEKKKKKVKAVYGHAVPYGVHELFKKKPRYFTFLRNPADRVVSQYNYLVTTFNREDAKGKNKPLYQGLLVSGEVPDFETWLKNKYAETGWKNLNHTLSVFLDRLGYLDLNNFSNSLGELQKKFFFIGFTKTFSEDAPYMYGKMGFNKFFLSQNVSKKFYEPENDEEVYSIAPEKFENDLKLFRKAKSYNKAIKKRGDYKKIVRKAKIKRRLILPITQLIFGFKDLELMIKNWIKDYLLQK